MEALSYCKCEWGIPRHNWEGLATTLEHTLVTLSHTCTTPLQEGLNGAHVRIHTLPFHGLCLCREAAPRCRTCEIEEWIICTTVPPPCSQMLLQSRLLHSHHIPINFSIGLLSKVIESQQLLLSLHILDLIKYQKMIIEIP